jgi:hypothetical protein
MQCKLVQFPTSSHSVLEKGYHYQLIPNRLVRSCTGNISKDVWRWERIVLHVNNRLGRLCSASRCGGRECIHHCQEYNT